MKKALLLLFLLPALAAQAIQPPPPDTIGFKCGFDELLDSMMLDPEFAAYQKRMEFYIQKYKQQGLFVPEFEKPMQQDMMMFSGGFGSGCDTCYGTPSLYVIPVVVHIVHKPYDSIIGKAAL